MTQGDGSHCLRRHTEYLIRCNAYLNIAIANPLPLLPRIGVARADHVADEVAVSVDEFLPMESDIRIVDGKAGQFPGWLYSTIVRFHGSDMDFTAE